MVLLHIQHNIVFLLGTTPQEASGCCKIVSSSYGTAPLTSHHPWYYSMGIYSTTLQASIVLHYGKICINYKNAASAHKTELLFCSMKYFLRITLQTNPQMSKNLLWLGKFTFLQCQQISAALLQRPVQSRKKHEQPVDTHGSKDKF